MVVFRSPRGVQLLRNVACLWVRQCWSGFVSNFPHKNYNSCSRCTCKVYGVDFSRGHTLNIACLVERYFHQDHEKVQRMQKYSAFTAELWPVHWACETAVFFNIITQRVLIVVDLCIYTVYTLNWIHIFIIPTWLGSLVVMNPQRIITWGCSSTQLYGAF